MLMVATTLLLWGLMALVYMGALNVHTGISVGLLVLVVQGWLEFRAFVRRSAQ